VELNNITLEVANKIYPEPEAIINGTGIAETGATNTSVIETGITDTSNTDTAITDAQPDVS